MAKKTIIVKSSSNVSPTTAGVMAMVIRCLRLFRFRARLSNDEAAEPFPVGGLLAAAYDSAQFDFKYQAARQ